VPERSTTSSRCTRTAPTRSCRCAWPEFWHLETFLYLTDVDDGCAPPRLVPRRWSHLFADEMYDHEIVATGRRGTLVAYRSDVWHRAPTSPDRTPRAPCSASGSVLQPPSGSATTPSPDRATAG
jgi:hypothetical protein